MNPTIERFSRLYAKLTCLYPYDFRCVFANEMQAVLKSGGLPLESS